MTLEVQPAHVVMAGSSFRIETRYDSSLSFKGRVSLARLHGNLDSLERALAEDSPSPPAQCSFNGKLQQSLRRGIGLLQAGRLAEGARALKGRGLGLTPSGDDFLAGFLLGLNALHAAFGLDVSKEVRILRRASRSRNLFSEAFLRCAAEGRFFEQAKALAWALFEGGESEVRRACARLRRVGASSGADLGAGLLCALRLHCAGLQKVSA